MKRNLAKSGGTIFSEKVLLELVDKGIPRDTAYRWVQRHALKVGRDGGELKEELSRDAEIRRVLPAQELERLWGVEHHLANVDLIFRRVFHGSSRSNAPG
jgi:adenylosuccinate lyase